MTIEAIIARMEWAARRQLAEYACHVDGQRITIRRGEAGAPSRPAPVPETPATVAEDPDGAVAAPLGGLCHLRPESGGAAFVRPGDRVEAGQTLCIIEAMKMMTPIPAETSGTVEEIFVTDGETVAAGAPLMRIR